MIISHDMGVIANSCDRVLVMYSGRVVEIGPVALVYNEPLHPYTKGLIRSIPRIDREEKPHTIRGELPSPVSPPPGCRFAPRCSKVSEICHRVNPYLRPVAADRSVACHLFREQRL